ncbi:MAG TPA: lipid A biosynthesis lauroyl acyltransferase [Xanthobacteraceae bacterium]|nr:lipid A biosynthesis lauroyl acyltransferase [Xanthobacteraceae bacterium]
MAARGRPGGLLKAWFDAVVGWTAVGLLRLLRLVDRKRTSNVVGRMMRAVGPWFPEHKIGRENLVAAFPDKSPQEIEVILGGVWENLGRVGAEFAHLDRMKVLDFERGGAADVVYDRIAFERFLAIRDSGKPTLVFSAHLANWEVPALAPAYYNVRSNLLYRRPNLGAAADAVVKMRAGCMGNLIPSGLDAPVRLLHALERGEHVGMLVDQHMVKGVDVVFFGRWAKANPLIAQLARHSGAAIRGVRVVRQGDGNSFWGELTDEIAPARDADGKVDIQGTMQIITSVVEGWVREHPEQWLWLHRRWR